MAWTAPRDWNTGEIETAAIFNTHIRDNLNYLKGNAGAVEISDTLQATRLGVGVAPSASYVAYFKQGNSPMRLELSTSAVNWLELRSTSVDATNKWALRIRDIAEGDFDIYDMTAGAPRMYINSAGNVGIGNTSPQGRLHGYDTISGFMHWKFDGVDGTARTVIPDGAGDVVYVISGTYVVRASDGTRSAGALGAIAPSVSTNIYDPGGAGTNVLQFQVAANGSVTVQRTAGSLTYKVALWLLWM